MRPQPSTAPQRAFVAALAYELRYAPQEYGPVGTFDEASTTIEWLLNIRRERWSSTPMHAPMRKAIFATLRASGKNKEDLYSALGIASLSDAARPSYLTGRRCHQWIEGKPLEPDHVAEPSSFADGLAALTRPQYPRPSRPDGYVPTDPLVPDPVFAPNPEPAMSNTVAPAPVRPRGRPGFDPLAQPPRPVRQPVAAAATVKAAAPVVAPQQPIRRPMGRPGMPVRPMPVAQPAPAVAQPAPAPVVAASPVTSNEDKRSKDAGPFVYKPNTPARTFEPKPLPPVDTRLGRVEALTVQRLDVLNEIISTPAGIEFLTRIASDNAPAWQALSNDWRSDIPF